MQLEDKELEGPELEREQRLEVEEAPRELEATELPALAGEEVRDIELLHGSRVLEAMQAVLACKDLNLSLLYLPRRETEALSFLQTAVRGRDELGRFVFAEDREALLEQSLAVLQENITHGDAGAIAELEAQFSTMTAQVATLRTTLTDLEDAQDELLEHSEREVIATETAEPETDAEAPAKDAAKKAPKRRARKADAAAPVAAAPGALADYLAGPELPARAPHVSALSTGPEVARVAQPTTLVGPDVGVPPPHASTLDGPAVPAKPPHASTLDGPEVPAKPPHASTLGGDG